MKSLKPHEEHLTLCTYCPSLCRHACPVATAEGRDTVSPWGLMSVAGHVMEKRVRLSQDLAEVLYHCTGCGACTDACKHDVPVATTLVDARAEVVARGMAPVGAEAFVHRFKNKISAKRATGHAKTPSILVLPGHRDVPPDGEEVRVLLKLADRLGESELGISPTSWLDTGASLWQAGYREGFRLRPLDALREAHPGTLTAHSHDPESRWRLVSKVGGETGQARPGHPDDGCLPAARRGE